MNILNLQGIVNNVKNKTNTIEEYIIKRGSTAVSMDYSKKELTITTASNKKQNSGIILISKIVNLNTNVYIDIDYIQTTRPVLNILDSNENVIETMDFQYNKGKNYILDFNLKESLKNILNDNHTCYTPINLMIKETSKSLPKKIFIINDISIVSKNLVK